MKKIALCNQKGGVAKTTSAVNLAAYLAIKGKRTLLIDLDPQANATSGLGVKKEDVESSIYDVLHENVAIDETILDTCVEGLSIVPSSISLTGAEVELVNIIGREFRLKKAVLGMKKKFDYLIVDCPPSLGLLTINGLAMVSSIIIPIQCEYYALEGLGQLINTYDLIRENLNRDLSIEGVVMTMADFRTTLAKEVISEVKNYFGEKVYDTIIPRTIKLTESPGFGKPIALYDAKSLGAKKYNALAEEVFSRAEERLQVPQERQQPQETKEQELEEYAGRAEAMTSKEE